MHDEETEPIAVSGPAEAEVLEAVSFALASRLELEEVLHLLARVARRTTDAARASILLLQGDQMVPAASVGPEPDAELFAAFRAMDPLRPSELPPLAVLLDAGVPQSFVDARRDDTIPRVWAERFSVVSCALVPLRAGDDIAGLMAVDHPEPGWFDEQMLRVLGTLGRYAGVAVRDARVHAESEHRAALMTRVAASAATLAHASAPGPLARALADAGTDLLGSHDAAVVLLDRGGTRARIVPSTGEHSTVAMKRAQLPQALRDALDHAHTDVVHVIGDFGWLEGPTAVAPLVLDERVRGLLAVAVDETGPRRGAELEAVGTLASIGAAAIERVMLVREVEDTLWRLEVLANVGARTDSDGLEGLRAALSEDLGRHGIEVVGLRVEHPELARLLGEESGGPNGQGDVDRRTPGRLHDGTVVVPLRGGDGLLGTLRLRTTRQHSEDDGFLEALGRRAAELLDRLALRRRLDGVADQQQRIRERDELTTEVCDGLRDVLGAVTAAVGATSGDGPRRVRELARTAEREVREYERALDHLPADGADPSTALEELLRDVARDAGIDVVVNVDEQLDRLPAPTAWMALRVAHRALVRAWSAGRATVVRLEVAVGPDAVALRVHDDGVGLGNHQGSLVGAFGLRRVVTAAGGRLHVERTGTSSNELVISLPRGAVQGDRTPRPLAQRVPTPTTNDITVVLP